MGQMKIDLFSLQGNQAQPGMVRAPRMVTPGCEQPCLVLLMPIFLPLEKVIYESHSTPTAPL